MDIKDNNATVSIWMIRTEIKEIRPSDNEEELGHENRKRDLVVKFDFKEEDFRVKSKFAKQFRVALKL